MNDATATPDPESSKPSGVTPGSALPDGRLLDGAVACVAASGVVASLGALLVSGLTRGGGALVGGALATANLWIIVRLSRAWLASPRHAWGVIGAAKLVALLTITLVILRSGLVDGLGFALGYAALPLGIVAAQVVAALRAPAPPAIATATATATATDAAPRI